MADIVKHPAAKAPPAIERAPDVVALHHQDWPEPGDPTLALETRELIVQVKHEIGLRWCTFPLRLQVEKIEHLLDAYNLST